MARSLTVPCSRNEAEKNRGEPAHRGPLGLGAGALVGDPLQGQEYRDYQHDEDIRRSNADLERQRYELERLRRDRGEY